MYVYVDYPPHVGLRHNRPDVGGNTNTGGGDNGGSPAVPRTVTRPAMTAQTTMAMAILTALISATRTAAVTVCGSENSEEACGDGIDNDGDGRVDCEDAN